MTTLEKLNPAARQLLGTYQNANSPIDSGAQAKITEAAQAKGQPLDAKELENILTQAMPAQKSKIATAAKACCGSSYHCDGKKADFLTQMLDFRITKETAEVFRQPPTRRTYRDPLEASFVLDNDAQVVLLFNARDVDASGRPLLMKVVAREGAKIDDVDLSQYRTNWAEGKEDIRTISKTAAYLEIKDTNESEFAFGDPLLQVSLDKKGKELSRGVAVNPTNTQVTHFFQGKNVGGKLVPDTTNPFPGRAPQTATAPSLDRQAVVSFDDRIGLEMKCKDNFPEGGWLDTKAAFVDAKLRVEPGLIFEPDTTATVTFAGATIKTAVANNDAFLVGSEGGEMAVNMSSFGNHTLRQLLSQPISRHTQSGGGSADANQVNQPAVRMVFPHPERIGVGAGNLAPLADKTVQHAQFAASKLNAEFRPVTDNTGGQQVCVRLEDGFLSAKDGASVKDWTVVVGFTDHAGKWQQCDSVTVKNKTKSGCEEFSLNLENAAAMHKANRNLEVRVFNNDGIPAQRVNIPIRQIEWAAAAAQGS